MNALESFKWKEDSKRMDTERVKFDGKKEITCTAVWSLAEIVLQTRKPAVRVKILELGTQGAHGMLEGKWRPWL